MSTEYYVRLHVGYQVSEDEFKRVFLKSYDGKFHMEPRFDAKTGKELEPEKVWDVKPKHVYEFDDLRDEASSDRYGTYMSRDSFVEGVGKKLECVAQISADQGEEGSGCLRAIFSVPIPKSRSTFSARMGIEYDALPVAAIPDLLPQLETLGTRLRSIGFNVGAPEVIISHYCSY